MPPSPAITPPQDQTVPALAQTAMGKVRGVVESDHRLFAGIPYAAPPVGPLRFQPPGTGESVEGRARCHQARAALHPGSRRRPRVRQAERRGLPDAQRLDAGGDGTAEAGDGVDPRRVVHRRQRQEHTTAKWLVARGDIIVVTDQLPARDAGVPGPPGARAARRRRQLRIGRPAGGAALGPGQHRQFRRRSGEGHRGRSNRPAACRCATTWSHRARRDCSVRRSSRARRVGPKPTCRRPNGAASTTPRGRGAAIRKPPRSACGRCRSTNCENR